jgi:peroxiredoxin
MTTRRALVAGGAVAIAAAAAGAGGAILRLRSQERDAAATNALFALTLPDASGAPQALAQWKGRPLVVNFWAAWCAPCVEEMPDLQRVRDEYRARGFEVIGVGIDSAARIRQFRDDHQITLPLLVAGADGSLVGDRLGNAAGVLPYTVLIGADGQVAERKIGRIRPDELRRWLDSKSAPTS